MNLLTSTSCSDVVCNNSKSLELCCLADHCNYIMKLLALCQNENSELRTQNSEIYLT